MNKNDWQSEKYRRTREAHHKLVQFVEDIYVHDLEEPILYDAEKLRAELVYLDSHYLDYKAQDYYYGGLLHFTQALMAFFDNESELSKYLFELASSEALLDIDVSLLEPILYSPIYESLGIEEDMYIISEIIERRFKEMNKNGTLIDGLTYKS